jgi:hypothetical protein
MSQATEGNTVWVAPPSAVVDDERGTPEAPYTDVARAVAASRPGQTVMLRPGVYEGDCTIQQSGTMEQPVRISSERPGEAVVAGSGWFLYDVSDVIITGLTFRDAPGVALSMIGACCRNSLDDIRFLNCSRARRPACTLFFGGSGASCNIVQNCLFRHDEPASLHELTIEHASAALMVAQGDVEGGAANVDFVVRNNTFVNYEYGMLLGTRDTSVGQYGHLVEGNTLEHCALDAIVVKCGDTTVHGNRLVATGRTAIALLAGASSVVVGNRVSDAACGVQVCDCGHTIAENCFVRCREQAAHVAAGLRPELPPAALIIVERNTMVDCGVTGCVGGVRADEGTSCIVEGNLFAGPALPYVERRAPSDEDECGTFATDNVVTDDKVPVSGCRHQAVTFADRSGGDLSNDSGCGASGWMLTDAAPLPVVGSASNEEESAEYGKAIFDAAQEASEVEREVDELVEDVDQEDRRKLGLFFESDDA